MLWPSCLSTSGVNTTRVVPSEEVCGGRRALVSTPGVRCTVWATRSPTALSSLVSPVGRCSTMKPGTFSILLNLADSFKTLVASAEPGKKEKLSFFWMSDSLLWYELPVPPARNARIATATTVNTGRPRGSWRFLPVAGAASGGVLTSVMRSPGDRGGSDEQVKRLERRSVCPRIGSVTVVPAHLICFWGWAPSAFLCNCLTSLMHSATVRLHSVTSDFLPQP